MCRALHKMYVCMGEGDRLQGEIVRLANNTLAAQAKNERDALQVQLRELEAENNAHLASQRVPVE